MNTTTPVTEQIASPSQASSVSKSSRLGQIGHLKLNEDDFRDHFNRRPFTIEHSLNGHELLSLKSLVGLSQALPEDRVEYNAGNLPLTVDPTATPRNGLSVTETIERIRNNQSWLVLKNVERVPEYEALLNQCLEEVRPYSELASSGMTHRQGFIFISSPGSVTPFHIDPENNFLLQIQGSKTVWMFGQNDRTVLSEERIEEFFSGAHRNMEFNEAHRVRGQEFELQPGQGLHFPVVAPHFVMNGPDVSISFSITFQTEDSADRQSLHRFNRKLRRLGMTPSPVGANAAGDERKLRMLRMMRKAKHWFPGK